MANALEEATKRHLLTKTRVLKSYSVMPERLFEEKKARSWQLSKIFVATRFL